MKRIILLIVILISILNIVVAASQTYSGEGTYVDIDVKVADFKKNSIVQAISDLIFRIFKVMNFSMKTARVISRIFIGLALAIGGISLLSGGIELNELLKKRIVKIVITFSLINAYLIFFNTIFNLYIEIGGNVLSAAELQLKDILKQNHSKSLKQLSENIKLLETALKESKNYKEAVKELQIPTHLFASLKSDNNPYWYELIKQRLDINKAQYQKLQNYINEFTLFVKDDSSTYVDGRLMYLNLKGKMADPSALMVAVIEAYRSTYETETGFDFFKALLKAIVFILGLVATVIIVINYYIAIIELAMQGVVGPLLITGMYFEKFNYLAEKWFGGLVTHLLKSLTISTLYILILGIVLSVGEGIEGETMDVFMYMLLNSLFIIVITVKLPSFVSSLTSGQPSLDMGTVASSAMTYGKGVATTGAAVNKTAQRVYNAGHSFGGAVSEAIGSGIGKMLQGGSHGEGLGAMGKSLAKSAGNSLKSVAQKWKHNAMGIKNNNGIQDKQDLDFVGGENGAGAGADAGGGAGGGAGAGAGADAGGGAGAGAGAGAGGGPKAYGGGGFIYTEPRDEKAINEKLDKLGNIKSKNKTLNPYTRLSQRAYNTGTGYWRERFAEGIQKSRKEGIKQKGNEEFINTEMTNNNFMERKG